MRGKSIGIDFGDLYTVTAQCENDVASIVMGSQGRLTPTAVSFCKNKRMIGENAKNIQLFEPDTTYTHLKSMIGLVYESSERKNLEEYTNTHFVSGGEYSLIEGRNGVLSPNSLVLYFLNNIIREDQTDLKTIIVVPHHWTSDRCELLLAICHSIGMNKVEIISDVIANAIYYAYSKPTLLPKNHEDDITNVFINIGESSSNVSVIKIGKKSFHVIASVSDLSICGRAINDELFNFFSNELKKMKIKLPETKRFKLHLLNAIEILKRSLSMNKKAVMELTVNTLDLSIPVERSTLENVLSQLSLKLISLINKTLEIAKTKPNKCKNIELIGRATRMPMIKTIVSNYFKTQVTQSMNVDEAAALGAAVYGNINLMITDYLEEEIIAEWTMNGHKTAVAFKSGCEIPSISTLRMLLYSSKIIRLSSNGRQIAILEVFTKSKNPVKVQLTLFIDGSKLIHLIGAVADGKNVEVAIKNSGMLSDDEITELKLNKNRLMQFDLENQAAEAARNELEKNLIIAERKVRKMREELEETEKNIQNIRKWFEKTAESETTEDVYIEKTKFLLDFATNDQNTFKLTQQLQKTKDILSERGEESNAILKSKIIKDIENLISRLESLSQ